MSQASQIELMIKNLPANVEDIRDAGSNFSILAWRIPWTEEPGELQSIASQRVRHDSSDLAHTHICLNSFALNNPKKQIPSSFYLGS